MEVVLELKNITKDYGRSYGVFDINFDLKKGSIIGLLGQNGAGKTTTIKMIMNLIKPTCGNILVFGQDYSKHEKHIKDRIGFVYDELKYNPTHNVRNVKNSLQPFYSKWNNEKFDYYIKRFMLPDNIPIFKMSKGMKVKVSIAIALSHHAELLIMDEPTSSLDPVARGEILNVLLELKKSENTSILFSSHITSDIENIADEVIILEKGQIIEKSSLEALLSKYYLVKGDVKNLGYKLDESFATNDNIGITSNKKCIDKLINKEGIEILKPTLEEVYLSMVGMDRENV